LFRARRILSIVQNLKQIFKSFLSFSRKKRRGASRRRKDENWKLDGNEYENGKIQLCDDNEGRRRRRRRGESRKMEGKRTKRITKSESMLKPFGEEEEGSQNKRILSSAIQKVKSTREGSTPLCVPSTTTNEVIRTERANVKGILEREVGSESESNRSKARE